jgi:predicted transcriptional regulator
VPSAQRRGPNLASPDDLARRPSGFATDLYRARITAGLTQRELSIQSGIDQAYLSAYENARLTPGHDHLARLKAALAWED